MRTSVTITKENLKSAPIVLQGDYMDSFKFASQSKFKDVELHLTDPKKIDLTSFQNGLKQFNLGLSALGTGLNYGMLNLSLTDANSKGRYDAIQRIKECIDFAKIFGSVIIIGTIVGKVSDCTSKEIYLDRLTQSVSEVLNYAEEQNVLVVIEAINRYESDFINNAEQALDFVSSFKNKYLKIHLDTFHMNIEEPNIQEAIKKCKGLLGHVHIADNTRLYPGSGQIDFENIIQCLKQINYNGAVSVECLPGSDFIETCNKSGQYLNNLLK